MIEVAQTSERASMESDDDVFFADLSKQIALLIMDDDNNDDEQFPVKQHHQLPVPVQGFAYVPPEPFMPPPLAYELAYRRESKGTGVFIPRSSLPRRKSRSSRSSAISASSNRQTDKPGVSVLRLADSNCRYSDNYNSGVPRRHPN